MSLALRLDRVSRRFGELAAVSEVSFDVPAGERHAVIGPNGAGKTTLFNLVAGTLRPSSGRITLFGGDVTRRPEHRRARLGLARTFQHSELFLRETVLENVLLARQRVAGTPWAFWRSPVRVALLDDCHRLLEAVGLADRPAMSAGALSHGQRRQLEIAIALAAEPRLLLLDEPAAGLSAAETEQLLRVIRDLPPETTVLLIEHDLELVLGLADQITVLHLGEHVLTGPPNEVRESAAVQQAYLGVADA